MTLSGANTATPSFTAPNNLTTSPTDLTFSLVVTDNQGATSAADTVVIHDTDQAPTANAGPDQTVNGGSTVNLNGNGSSDPNGDTLTYAWTQTGGTNTVTLSGANTATPSFTAPNAKDTLTFQLQVCDPAGMCGTDTVTSQVQPDARDGRVRPGHRQRPGLAYEDEQGVRPQGGQHRHHADHDQSEQHHPDGVNVNGTATGSVTVNPFTKTLNPGASTRVKLDWSYGAGAWRRVTRSCSADA